MEGNSNFLGSSSENSANLILKRKRYDNRDKVRMINEFRESQLGYREFASIKGLDHTLISRWDKDYESLKLRIPTFKKIKPANTRSSHPDLEKHLLQWFIARRQCGYQVNKYCIKLEALKIAKELAITGFKASHHWFDNFKARNALSFRKVNDSNAKSFKVLFKLCDDYVNELEKVKALFSNRDVYNFDETRFEWDVKSRFTYDFKGATRIRGIHTTKANHALTVFLMISASGRKLPAMIVFKEANGIIPPRIQESLAIPENCFIRATNSSYVDTETIKDYYFRYFRRERKLILLDLCTIHATPAIKQMFKETKAELLYIPGQCTKFLQPLDSIVMNSFKKCAENYRIEAQVDQVAKRTTRGNIKPMDRQTIMNIVSRAWKDVKKETILKSFSLTGLYGRNHTDFMAHNKEMGNKLAPR